MDVGEGLGGRKDNAPQADGKLQRRIGRKGWEEGGSGVREGLVMIQ